MIILFGLEFGTAVIAVDVFATASSVIDAEIFNSVTLPNGQAISPLAVDVPATRCFAQQSGDLHSSRMNFARERGIEKSQRNIFSKVNGPAATAERKPIEHSTRQMYFRANFSRHSARLPRVMSAGVSSRS
jgi:hypothetical protein